MHKDENDDVPTRPELERIAVEAAQGAADVVRNGYGRAVVLGTKSSATDVVTETDVASERLIVSHLDAATPNAGIIGEESGTRQSSSRLQWIIDPLDGTVNFLYALPIFSISIAAAVDGHIVAGAVVDVLYGQTYSACLDGGARRDGASITTSGCTILSQALLTTGFSYDPRLRALQGSIVASLLPTVRDIRCFGSAALQLCWVADGRADGYFERDIKLWDWAAGTLIAAEAGASVEYACPENNDLILATSPSLFADIADAVRIVPRATDATRR